MSELRTPGPEIKTKLDGINKRLESNNNTFVLKYTQKLFKIKHIKKRLKSEYTSVT